MNNNYYKSPESSRLMKMFWKAAGADQYLLERSTYSDQVKYFCLGGIVIATGVMAALAGGYAFYTIFNPLKGNAMATDIHMPTVLLSSFFGAIWGLIIFNIDRFIVTSTGKGDGTEAITAQEFKSAIPRIVMGMIIALTISKPVEIRMFQSEINVAVAKVQQDSLKRFDDVTRKEFDISLNEIDAKSMEYKEELRELKAKIDEMQAQYVEEARTITVGPRARAVKAELDKLESKYSDEEKINKPKIEELSKRRIELEKKRDKQLQENKQKVDGYDGLLLRIRMAHKEAGTIISLFITLLFMVIELTPIFFKMMLIKGPYDYMDENVKELARAEAGIEIEYDFYKEKDGMEKHKVINHAAEVKMKERLMILKAQEEINERVIQEWKKKKFDDIDKNPSSFIDEN